MTHDPVSDALEILKLKGTVYFQADFREPWGMAIPAKRVAAFHLVVAGECWLRVFRRDPIRLSAGSIVLLPHGSAHELAHDALGAAQPPDEILAGLGEDAREPGELQFGGDGRCTTLVCGHFSYDQRHLHPFFESLPDLIRVHIGGEARGEWLATAARLAALESSSDERAAAVVVDRLAEALLIQTLRLFVRQATHPTGFLAAVYDPPIGRALEAMHKAVAHPWNVQSLADSAGMSRSAFALRFRQLVGESPMRYLARWRMLEGRRMLSTPGATVGEVAHRVGYQSEFAFARAFKRLYGEGPGAFRRAAS